MRDISLSLSGGLNAPSTKAFLQFIEYLDDQKPPMFVEQALTYVLRTEPPVHVTTDGLLDLVGSWARERAAESGRPLSDLYVAAVRKIVDASRSNSIKDFDLHVFYPAFTQGLRSRCPDHQRPAFDAGLLSLEGQIQERWEQPRESEYETTSSVELGGLSKSIANAADDLVEKLSEAGRLSDEEFEATLAALDRLLVTRAGMPVRSLLERVVAAGVGLLNAARPHRAASVFALATTAAARCELHQDDLLFVWEPAELDRLEPTVLGRLSNDVNRQHAIGTLVRCLPDLRLEPALFALEHDRSRDRRRFLLKVIELRGAEALPEIFDRLAAPRPGGSWFLARNLIYVLSRLEIAFDADRRRAVDAVAPYLTSEQPQLRSIAFATLKRLAGQGLEDLVASHVVRAIDPSAYPPAGDDAREALFNHVCQAIDFLAAHGGNESLDAVARVAVGDRGGEFRMGQSLREHAIAALARRPGPLSRAATRVIVAHLSQVADRRLKLVVGRLALGVDVAACRALVGLIQGSPDPEVRELLAAPVIRKIAGR